MLAYKPRHASKLGVGETWAGLTGGLTSGMAKDIVNAAEPPVRKIVQEERYRFATAVMGGLTFFGLGTLAYLATRYFVPDGKNTAKGVGYLAAAAAGTVGAWYTVSELKGTPVAETAAAQAPGQPASGTINSVAQSAAKAIVTEAEPRIRKIVDEERARIAEAGQAVVPFAIGSVATLLATFFMVGADNNKMKALGYAGSALLLGAGLWIGLEKVKEVA